jgi:hypothetical protein
MTGDFRQFCHQKDRLRFYAPKYCSTATKKGAGMDISKERLLTLSEAAKLLPRRRGGKKTHVASLYRWSKVGLKGIRLEVLRAGGVTCTSQESLQRFFDALTARSTRPVLDSRPEPKVMNSNAVEIALDSLGICESLRK